MNKNYYEILQVDKKASQEIIEKAYKLLAKKYHPDLREDVEKKYAEEAFKMISEAYETLSNPQKRAEYDKTLKYFNITEKDIDFLYEQNQVLREKLDTLTEKYNYATYNQQTTNYHQSSNTYQNNFSDNSYQNYDYNSKFYRGNTYYNDNSYQDNYQNTYQDTYEEDSNNSFFDKFKLRNLKFLGSRTKFIFSIGIIIIIIYILWHLPFVRDFFDYLYDNNFIVRYIADFFSALFG